LTDIKHTNVIYIYVKLLKLKVKNDFFNA